MQPTTKAVPILLKAAKSLSLYLEKDMRSYGLNPAEFSTLELLYHKGPQPMKDIGDRLLLAGSSMTYVIDKLETKEYVVRQKSIGDRRQVYVALTDTGKAHIADIFSHHEHAIAKVFAVISEEEYHNLMILLKKVGYHSRALMEEKE